jgi:hypothetical protein
MADRSGFFPCRVETRDSHGASDGVPLHCLLGAYLGADFAALGGAAPPAAGLAAALAERGGRRYTMPT